MGKQDSVVFRSATAGYNKRDVNQFILNMNAKFSAAEEEYKREISELKAHCQNSEQDAEKIRAMEAENESLRRELDALRAEVEELRRIKEAVVSGDAEELDDLRKKAALYDTMSSKFGDVMLTASYNAEQMILDARRESEQTLDAAKSVIGQGTALLSTRLEELYRSANLRAVNEIHATVHSAQQALSRFLDDFARQRAQLDEILRQHNAELCRTTDEQIVQIELQGKAALETIYAPKSRSAAEAKE